MKTNLTDMSTRYGEKHDRIFARRGYFIDSREAIKRAAEFHQQDSINKSRVRNQRNG